MLYLRFFKVATLYLRVYKAVIKAKGGYFEEYKIYFDFFNTFGYYMIPYELLHSCDVLLVFYNVENSQNKEKSLNE